MNTGANEGIGIAKMAVACILCALLVGAIVTLFYMFLNIGDQKFGSTKKSVETVNMEKLYTLQDQSLTADHMNNSVEQHPLVSAVSATLLEYDEKDLVYIYITSRRPSGLTYTYSGSKLFTYNGVSFTPGVLNVLPGYSSGVSYTYNDTILSAATKYLNQWSKYRCHLSVDDVPYGNDTLIGICIEVLEE